MSIQKIITIKDIMGMLVEYNEVLGPCPVKIYQLHLFDSNYEEVYTKLQNAIETKTPLDTDSFPLTS